MDLQKARRADLWITFQDHKHERLYFLNNLIHFSTLIKVLILFISRNTSYEQGEPYKHTLNLRSKQKRALNESKFIVSALFPVEGRQ